MPLKLPYYFNSANQIAGDNAYNQNDFIRALKYYENGLKNLLNFTAKKLSSEISIQDGCTYAMTDIIRTCFDVLYTLDEKELIQLGDNYWQKVDVLLLPLYKNAITISAYPLDQIETTPEHIAETYEIVSDYCERLSDKLADFVGKAPNKSKGMLLTEAIKWMQRSMHVREQYQSSGPLHSELHLGLLNLLEQKYLVYKKDVTLNAMLKHIEQYDLAVKKMTAPKKLELLGYYLLCNRDPAKQAEIIAKGKLLIPNLAKKNKKIVSDFNQKVKNVESKSSTVLIDEIQPSPALEKNSEPLILVEKTAPNGLGFFTTPRRAPLLDEHPNRSKKNAGDLPAFSRVAEVRDISKTTPVKKKTVRWGVNSIHTIPARPQQASLLKDYSKERTSVFLKVFDAISTDSPRPEFLASLLSLMGDFFSEHGERLKGEYFIADDTLKSMAGSLFLKAISIYPDHQVAARNYSRLYKTPPVYIAVGVELKAFYLESISDLLKELTRLPKEKTDNLVGELFEYVTQKINKFNLMKKETSTYLHRMRTIFEESKQDAPSHNNNNTTSP